MKFLTVGALIGAALGPVADTTPPAFIGAPAESYYDVTNRGLVGVSSCAVAPNGRLWATWYTGPTRSPDETSYLVLTTSADGGETWKEVCIVDPDRAGPRRVFDPELWIAPDGAMRWTWTDRRGHELSDPSKDGFWMMTIADPGDVPARWPVPRLVSNGVGIVKATVWSTGAWVWPVILWQGEPSTRLLMTRDGGRTFSIAGGITLPKELRYFDETVITEKRNGELWAFIRTKNVAHECFSMDRGKTWSAVKPARIAQRSARTSITRLRSGNLLLVKHGRTVGTLTATRTDLTAFLSKDDGETWEGGLLIDGRARVAYPDVAQAADGTIHLVYDRDRQADREILMAHFTEADVLAGKGVSPVFRLRQTVSRSSVPGGTPKSH